MIRYATQNDPKPITNNDAKSTSDSTCYDLNLYVYGAIYFQEAYECRP